MRKVGWFCYGVPLLEVALIGYGLVIAFQRTTFDELRLETWGRVRFWE